MMTCDRDFLLNLLDYCLCETKTLICSSKYWLATLVNALLELRVKAMSGNYYFRFWFSTLTKFNNWRDQSECTSNLVYKPLYSHSIYRDRQVFVFYSVFIIRWSFCFPNASTFKHASQSICPYCVSDHAKVR